MKIYTARIARPDKGQQGPIILANSLQVIFFILANPVRTGRQRLSPT